MKLKSHIRTYVSLNLQKNALVNNPIKIKTVQSTNKCTGKKSSHAQKREFKYKVRRVKQGGEKERIVV